MSVLGKVLEDAIAQASKAKKETEQANRRLTASYTTLNDLTDDLAKATNVVSDLRRKDHGVAQALVGMLGKVTMAQYQFIRSLETNAKQLVRGTTLLAPNAAGMRQNINLLEKSALAYSKALGASERDSMQLIANYQSTYKLVNGQLDAGADAYLNIIGNIGRQLGASVEDLSFLQNDVLNRKGKFGKDFSVSVGAMMLDASAKFGMNVRESAEAIDDTLNRSLHLDQEAREKAVKMGLEGAAISKKAAVDFGKYATALVGARGVDAMKGVAKLAALTGESMDEVDRLRRATEINKNGPEAQKYYGLQAKAAGTVTGKSDLVEAFSKATMADRMAMEQTVMAAMDGMDLQQIVEQQRVIKSVGKVDPLNTKLDRDASLAVSKEIETPDEARRRGEATFQEAINNLTPDIAKANLNVLEFGIGVAQATGLASEAFNLLTTAVAAATTALFTMAGSAITKGIFGRGAAGGAGAAGGGALGKLGKFMGPMKGLGGAAKVAGAAGLALDVANSGIKLSTEEGRADLRAGAENLDFGKNTLGTAGNVVFKPVETITKFGVAVSDTFSAQKAAKDATAASMSGQLAFNSRQKLIATSLEEVKAEAQKRGISIGDPGKLKQLVARAVISRRDPMSVLELLSSETSKASPAKPEWTAGRSAPTAPGLSPATPPANRTASDQAIKLDRLTEESLSVQKKMLVKLDRVDVPTIIKLSI